MRLRSRGHYAGVAGGNVLVSPHQEEVDCRAVEVTSTNLACVWFLDIAACFGRLHASTKGCMPRINHLPDLL